MRPWPVLLVLLAGCVAPQELPEGPGEGRFWMVWVHGKDAPGCSDGGCPTLLCDLRFDHAVDAAARSFRHLNASAPAQPWLVVAYDVAGEDCPAAYRHAFDAARDEQRLGGRVLVVETARNGTLVVDGAPVPPGGKARVAWERGVVVVENLGAWRLADVSTRWP